MITITFAGWMIPLAITIIGLIWAFFIVDGGGGMLSGLANILALIPVLFFSSVAWMLYAFFK